MQPKKDNVSVLIPFFDDDQDEENTPSTPEININKDIPKQEKIIEDGDELESDEENDAQDFQNPVPLSKVENYSLQNIIVPKYSSDDLTQPELKKIYELKVYTEEAIAKTVKNKNSSNIVKSLVSKKKNRFCYDGFDLDLTYITTRIIAMGMPSSNLEGLYRNPMEEVQKFLNTRHNEHYKVYNLCEERGYPKNSFYKQEVYPFKDHEAPPLNLMKSFCEDAKSFLDEDEKNIVAIHCKAGKGRTGTMICCLLLYMKIFGKGVTIPSQIRYVNYFEKILKSNMQHPIIFIKKCIKKIRMFTLPKFHGNYTPFFKIENNDNIYNSEKKKTEFKKEDLNAVVDFDIEKGFIVSGDVRVIFYRNKLITKQKENIFKFWFNTNFIPNDSNIYQFKKNEIDKACKDEECKYYSKAFLIEIHFIDV